MVSTISNLITTLYEVFTGARHYAKCFTSSIILFRPNKGERIHTGSSTSTPLSTSPAPFDTAIRKLTQEGTEVQRGEATWPGLHHSPEG